MLIFSVFYSKPYSIVKSIIAIQQDSSIAAFPLGVRPLRWKTSSTVQIPVHFLVYQAPSSSGAEVKALLDHF